jgi:hypothetical protein
MTDPLAISLTVLHWQSIDATMDNVAQTARALDDENSATQALQVREQGWRQVGGWRGDDMFPPWPPSDQLANVVLNADTWLFVLDGLTASIRTSESLLHNPQLNDASRAEQQASIDLGSAVAARVQDAFKAVDNL